MPDLFPTTGEAEKNKALELGIVNHLGPDSFKADADVNPESLQSARLLRDPRNPVVILGRGELKVALKVRAHRVSAGAKAKIEEAGGSVELIG